MKTYRTIIAGSRTIEDAALIERAIQESHFRITEVVSGGQVSRDGDRLYGADYFGEQWAKRQMIPIKRFPADWRQHGKSAGPKRNEEMARYADQLIAVRQGGTQSRGTTDMIERARYCGLSVFVLDI